MAIFARVKSRLAPLNKFFWRSRGIWIAAPTASLLILALRWLGALQFMELQTYDLLMRLRPPLVKDEKIVIVGIDESDVAKLKTATPSDALLAQLISQIKAMDPVAIGLDLYRDQPVPPGQAELTTVFEQTPNLIGIKKVVGEAGIDVVEAPPALEARGQVGSNDLPVDTDKVIRRGLLYLNNGQETFYSFGFYLALIYLDRLGISVQDLPNSPAFRLGQGYFRPLDTNEGSYIRTDANGFQLLVNYRGRKQHFDQVSMVDILEERVPKDWATNKIVLIGKVGESFKDVYFTPYSNIGGVSESMPGVEIHANIISQIIGIALLEQPLIVGYSELSESLKIIFWSLLGAIISWQFRYGSKNRNIQLLRWGAISGCLSLIVGTSYYAFLRGIWLPMIPSLLGFGSSAMLITGYMAFNGIKVRQTFGRYLTDQVVANLLENPQGLKLGGDRREITLLTSDLRGFTSRSERLSPEEVVKVLNFYFGHMADIITKYGGTIDEFMGDGILVLFGAPTAQEDDPQRAVACAVEMQLRLITVNQQVEAWGLEPLEMGIGINTGEMVVGNIGSEKRTKYGVVGSQVNLTYRIESFSIGGQILISERTFQAVASTVEINGSRAVKAKGIEEPILIYDVKGINSPYNLYLTVEETIYRDLAEPIFVTYVCLEGKQINDQIWQGKLIKLSPKEGIIESLDSPTFLPPPLTNIKINFPDAQLGVEVYAKVLAKPSANAQTFTINFSSPPPQVAEFLHQRYLASE
ncbi:MAG: adenylate/guanylate cyclase domain-containing protein [Synechocystis sp.]|nr:adenylate/guanylate cyclase domain-containing protein [Synechocystis sp.]